MHCTLLNKCKITKSQYMAVCNNYIEFLEEKIDKTFGYLSINNKAKCSLCKHKTKSKIYFGFVLREGKHIIGYEPPKTYLLTYICDNCLKNKVEFR